MAGKRKNRLSREDRASAREIATRILESEQHLERAARMTNDPDVLRELEQAHRAMMKAGEILAMKLLLAALVIGGIAVVVLF